jgi:hypothetical protein
MANEVVTTDQNRDSPFNRNMVPTSINAGAVAIESERAIAEAQGQMTLAKRFPRSVVAAIEEFKESCRSPDFAAVAFYAVSNRGSGPSIRFAEEAARCYGNMQYGHRELSRSAGKSEVEVFAWDMEKNNHSRRQIAIMHILDTKEGPRAITSQNDIDNRIGNVAARIMRGRILALMPKHLVAIGIAECKRTLAGDNEKPLSDRLLAMSNAFKKQGVSAAMLAKFLGHQVDDTTADELVDLTGIYNAIKDGAKASTYFNNEEDGEKKDSPAKTAIAAAIAKTAGTPTGQPESAGDAVSTTASAPTPKKAAVVKKTAPAPTPEPEPDQQPEPPPADDQGDAQGGDSDEVF